jgi:hypothetical protein
MTKLTEIARYYSRPRGKGGVAKYLNFVPLKGVTTSIAGLFLMLVVFWT